MADLWYVKSVEPQGDRYERALDLLKIIKINEKQAGKIDAAIMNLERASELITFIVKHRISDSAVNEEGLAKLLFDSQITLKGKPKLLLAGSGHYKPGTFLTRLPPMPICNSCVRPGDAMPIEYVV